MSQDQIQEIEVSLADARAEVERGRAVDRLWAHPDFKKIFIEGYFRDEAARLAMLSSDPGLRPEMREAILREMNGVGAVRRFLLSIQRMAQTAAHHVSEAEEALDELRAEDADLVIGGTV